MLVADSPPSLLVRDARRLVREPWSLPALDRLLGGAEMSVNAADRIAAMDRLQRMDDWLWNYGHTMWLARQWKHQPQIAARHRESAHECAVEHRRLVTIVLKPVGQLTLPGLVSAVTA